MAVSNAIGSNVFDVLVCLGLPWFIDTTMVNPGSTVKVKSKGNFYLRLRKGNLCYSMLNFCLSF